MRTTCKYIDRKRVTTGKKPTKVHHNTSQHREKEGEKETMDRSYNQTNVHY